MRFITTAPRAAGHRWYPVRVTRDAAIVAGAAAIVLVGAACSGPPKPAASTPSATARPAPQAAGAAKQATEALRSDLKPLNAAVPLPLRKLDGLAISMDPLPVALTPVPIDSDAGTVSVAVGAIAMPSFGVNLALGAPSFERLLAGLGGGVPAIPTMPTTIPTAPPGAAPGATPPAGLPTPPAGYPTPPAGFGPPTGLPSLPPGFTIPGMP